MLKVGPEAKRLAGASVADARPAQSGGGIFSRLMRVLGAGAKPASKASAKGSKGKPLTVAKRRSLERPPPSFVDLVPYGDFDDTTNSLILADGVSCAAVFEILPIATEGRSAQFIAERVEAARLALVASFPENPTAQWCASFFVQDDPDLSYLVRKLERYASPKRAAGTEFTRDFLQSMKSHLEMVSRPGGLFTDPHVTGLPFRGQRRRVRCVIYRRYPAGHDFGRDYGDANAQLEGVCSSFESAIKGVGVGLRRIGGREFWDWIVPWLNPNKEALRSLPYPSADDRPFGRDFAESLLYSMPVSDEKTGTWYFNGVPQVALTFQGLRLRPKHGHFTAEREFGTKVFTLFDKMPEGSILSMTVTIEPQYKVEQHVNKVARGAVGDNAAADLAAEAAARGVRQIAKGDNLLPLNMAVYVRGKDDADISQKTSEIHMLFNQEGARLIERRHDLMSLTSFVRGLPAAHCPTFDAWRGRRRRLEYSSDIARMLPLYGRQRGTGNPGMVFFNRGGEPLTIDPLNPEDRQSVAHMVVLGPTGMGKSAFGVYMVMQAMALHRPRIVLIDKGRSFDLVADYMAARGVSVYKADLNPSTDVSLPPYVDAYKIFETEAGHRVELSVPEDADGPAPASATVKEEDKEERDVMGEMELSTTYMITGGVAREEEKITRADRALIREGIRLAATRARDAGKPHPLVEDVSRALKDLSEDASRPQARRERAFEFGEAMTFFCHDYAGHLFNRYGTRWPDADFTVVELGLLAEAGYSEMMSMAVISLLTHFTSQLEKNQKDGRQKLFIIDEAHFVTRNPMLSPYIQTATKVWRKLFGWLQLLTQNLGDFPKDAERILGMCEYWVSLPTNRNEIEQMRRFRPVSAELESMLLSARKSKAQYTEGVVMTPRGDYLFRNVPPSIALTLAMTDGDEKEERLHIMDELGCSEVEAAIEMARRLDKKRMGVAA